MQSLRAHRVRELDSGIWESPESGKSAMLMEWGILGFEIQNTVL